MFFSSDDFRDRSLDLNELVLRRPAATFFLRARGRDIGAGVESGDILAVDRAEPPRPGRLAVVSLRGELALRRLPPGWREDDGLELWGVVTWILRAAR